MSTTSRLMARMFGLSPAETFDVAVERNLEVAMPDGVVLLADHYYPRNLGNRPTILFRTAYGRANAGFVSRLMAERGFQVVIQSSRGTDESGGEFDPFRQEHADGVATLAWLKTRPWFNGELGMTGASYLGFTQWALAHEAGQSLKAMSTQTISADFHSMLYHGQAFALELFLWWLAQMDAAGRHSRLLTMAYALKLNRKPQKALQHLPLVEMDKLAFDQSYPFWREWLTHDQANDTYWEGGDFRRTLAEIDTPNHMIDGWYDFFLPHLLQDYQILGQAGKHPYLTIGPWTHFDTTLQSTAMREGLDWMRAHLLGKHDLIRQSPVRLFIMGANEWRDFPTWPPADSQPQRWYLQSTGRVTTNLPDVSEPDSYRYDPRDPTPSVGGFARSMGTGRPVQDNRSLEARPDVLIYTSAPLPHDVEVIGPITAELFIKSSLEHTDFFVRLCDVYPDGRSMNVCDGILRLFPGQPAAEPDGCRCVRIDLWPTAYRFKPGHCIRVQVSSGAFPRFARNLGTGEPLATGTAMKAAQQSIYHDPAHPSSVILPISG